MAVESRTRGVDHVGLTVRNLADTRDFFIDCLGWEQVGEKPEYPAIFVSDGYARLTLWEVKNLEHVVAFDRKSNIGLHHLAIKVESPDALDDIFHRVSNWPGVQVEFMPEPLGKGPKTHTMIYEPGGIRIEFNYAPGV
ncbi:VOC family protein [Paraburkholderia sp. B3]|uniref:VOC family protein n=1 Tax=Paraburkholderia sp. B3 TaxID=3134791 RepID=UPI003982D657